MMDYEKQVQNQSSSGLNMAAGGQPTLDFSRREYDFCFPSWEPFKPFRSPQSLGPRNKQVPKRSNEHMEAGDNNEIYMFEQAPKLRTLDFVDRCEVLANGYVVDDDDDDAWDTNYRDLKGTPQLISKDELGDRAMKTPKKRLSPPVSDPNDCDDWYDEPPSPREVNDNSDEDCFVMRSLERELMDIDDPWVDADDWGSGEWKDSGGNGTDESGIGSLDLETMDLPE